MINQEIINERLVKLNRLNVECISFATAFGKGLLNNSTNIRFLNSNADIMYYGILQQSTNKSRTKYIIINEDNLENQKRNPSEELIAFLNGIIRYNISLLN